MKLARCQMEDGTVVCAQRLEDGSFLRLGGSVLDPGEPLGELLSPIRLLAPVPPPAIWGVGLNYLAHGNPLGIEVPVYPLLFAKQINSLQHPEGPILLPQRLAATQVDFEGELAVIISRNCKNVDSSQALDYVAGYTCANDVTARDWQSNKAWSGGQFTRAKSFDTFCPLGPWMVTPEDVPRPHQLRLRTWLNGVLMQDDSTERLVFDLPCLIAYLSSETTLAAGTVILTGSPSGTLLGRESPRWLQVGDRVEVEIEGIGRLGNSVAAAP